MNDYIAVIDYGVGNAGSILNMLKKAGKVGVATSQSDQIFGAQGMILPGVGSFDNGMQNLAKRGLISVLNEAVLVRRIPILGICLGMQLLTKGSEEGRMEGLGWIDAYTRRFRFEGDAAHLRIPHMGWNEICAANHEANGNSMADRLFPTHITEQRFYFVHSYHVCCTEPGNVLATARYGHEITAAIGKDNIVGVQFHPEKSHRFGMDLFCRFADSLSNGEGALND